MKNLLLTLVCTTLLGAPASAVTIDWVTVGAPGNACDVQSQGCFGAVATGYRISKFEVTNTQYAEFLNAVAAADTNQLYNVNMGDSVNYNAGHGGITRSGSSGSFTYSAIPGRGSWPVNWVSFWDSLRFANWLHNGQPTGAQGNATTEDGAYTVTALGISNNLITRNAGATIFLPSEDEWYKAAYYNAVSTSYFDYPAGTDTQTTCTPPPGGATPNTANCGATTSGSGPTPWDLADVGSYTASASPNGTFDQGGNVWEWNEAITTSGPFSFRVLRGGPFNSIPTDMRSDFRLDTFFPAGDNFNIGFRVATLAAVPEPGAGLLLMMGVLGLVYRQRRRASNLASGDRAVKTITSRLNRGVVLATTALLWVLIVPSAHATLIGLTHTGSPLYDINPATGAATPIGVGVIGGNSLAADSTGTVITFASLSGGIRQLISIDPATSFSAVVITLDPIIGGFNGLAFAPDDSLFGIASTSPVDAVDRLYSVDVGTGAVTLIGETRIGTTDVSSLQGLAFSASGTLYGWDLSLGLVTLDTSTAQVTDLPGGASAFIQTIEFAPDGSLFGAGVTLYSLDPGTGSFTAIGPTGLDIRGLAFVVPEPGAGLLLMMGMLGLAYRQRRRA